MATSSLNPTKRWVKGRNDQRWRGGHHLSARRVPRPSRRVVLPTGLRRGINADLLVGFLGRDTVIVLAPCAAAARSAQGQAVP